MANIVMANIFLRMCVRMCARVHARTHTFGRHAIARILQVAGRSEEEEEGDSGDMQIEGTER